MKVFTNRSARWKGETVPVTVRLPRPVVDFIDTHHTDNLTNRSDFLQHWAAVGAMLTEAREDGES